MTKDRRLEQLTRQGIELMRRERELALAGDLRALGPLNDEKLAFLEGLDALGREIEAGGPQPLQAARRRELETLFDILHRRAAENQALLRAAEVGVKSAARRIEEIFGGAAPVAYTPDGEKISSKSASTNTSELL